MRSPSLITHLEVLPNINALLSNPHPQDDLVPLSFRLTFQEILEVLVTSPPGSPGLLSSDSRQGDPARGGAEQFPELAQRGAGCRQSPDPGICCPFLQVRIGKTWSHRSSLGGSLCPLLCPPALGMRSPAPSRISSVALRTFRPSPVFFALT